MKFMIKKLLLAFSAAALVFAAFPVTSAFASDEAPPVAGEMSNERLERVWARQLRAYEKISKAFADVDAHTARFQERIDKAAENGKDISALQSALDAYKAAMNAAQPVYTSLAGIVDTHAGFDANGKVIDAEQAKSTLEQVRAKLQEIKSTMGGTFKALREALKTFRDINRPVEPRS